MAERKIVVPEGMLKAALDAHWSAADRSQEYPRCLIEAALRWLSENPIEPTDKECDALLESFALGGETRRGGPVNRAQVRCLVTMWQRRMRLEPEPEEESTPEEDLNAAAQAFGDAFFRLGAARSKLAQSHFNNKLPKESK